jgi:hypothetical protein
MNTLAARTEHMPECVVCADGIEIPARYEIDHEGYCYLHAVKINGCWADPLAVGFSGLQIQIWEADILDVEHSIAAEAA